MADNRIALIPQDPLFMPDEPSRQVATNRFAAISPDADEIEIKMTDRVQFFDYGANLERISCPSCGHELDSEWWQQRMNEDYSDGGFQLLNYPTPCCRALHSLNGLRYDWPQGFARFAINAMNPNIGELTSQQIEGFEAILGTPLRVIYQHI